jgi:hypothetical protein
MAENNQIPPNKSSWRAIEPHLTRFSVLLWVNIITIAFLSILSLYAKIERKGQGVENLFSDPFNIGIFYLGWLTSISEILWCVAIVICLFTVTLLPKLNSQSKFFLLASALLMSWLYFDDRFRLTLILCVFFGTYRLVKVTIYLIYGVCLLLYVWRFKSIIWQTPYIPLLIAFGLFAFSSTIDITPMNSPGIHAMLEDGTKLIGLINLSVYFWYICRETILLYFSAKNEGNNSISPKY